MNNNSRIVIYPCGCQPIYPSSDESELLKRLEQLNYELRDEEDGSDGLQVYKPLALHLTFDFFINHRNKGIQVLVAECIANLLRMSTPFSPYEDHPDARKIFIFLINQLENLADPQSELKNRSQAVLSNLIHVNAFILCLPLEKSEEIFTYLFSSIFRILETNETEEIKSLATILMTSLLQQAEEICEQVLGIVFENFIKESNRLVVKKMLESLGTKFSSYMKENFVNILSRESNSSLMDRAFTIASALSAIYPGLIEAILLQLTKSLNSEDIDRRANSVSILSSLLSAEGSNLQELVYLDAFFHRFIDTSERIRILCIEKCRDFLLNHPALRKKVVKRLKLMQYDKCDDVRYQVILTIISTAQKNLKILEDEPELFNCIEERSFDVSDKIRRKILRDLTSLYCEYSGKVLSNELQSVLTKIVNKILSSYHLQDEGDKYYIEKILNTWLIDFRSGTDLRVAGLLELFVKISNNARKAFVQMQLYQQTFRKLLNELLQRLEELNEGKLERVIKILSTLFPEPEEADVNLHKFCGELATDSELFKGMKSFVYPHASCSSIESNINRILSKIGDPDATDPHYRTIKILLARSSSVLIDAEAVFSLITNIEGKLRDNTVENCESVVIKGSYLLEVLSFVLPAHFSHDRIIDKLILLLEERNAEVTSRILSTINNTGKYVLQNPSAVKINLNGLRISLEPICKSFVSCGTRKQVKQAIRAISIFLVSESDQISREFLSATEESLDPSSPGFQTAIATIGYIATYSACNADEIKRLIKKLTQEVVVAPFEEPADDPFDPWCRRDQLPSRTISKLLAMKSVTRCLLSLNSPGWTKQIFKVFNFFLETNGDIFRGEADISQQEMTWLRLQAGTCMLKLCRFEGFDNRMTSAQFYNLSRLMQDEVEQVRIIFSGKLEEGLRPKYSGEFLPIDFMGFYALGGLESEEIVRGQLRSHMVALIRKKKTFVEYPFLRGDEERSEVWSNLGPQCVLIYALPILVHIPQFSDPENVEQLMMIKKCLEFILQPYVDNNKLEEEEMVNYYCFFDYLIEKLRHYRDSQMGDGDDLLQVKYFAVCDLAKLVIDGKTSKKIKNLAVDRSAFFDSYIPKKYLTFDETLEARVSSGYFLPADILENIVILDAQEKRRLTAARNAEKRMMNRTFGFKPQKKRKIGGKSAIIGDTTEKKRHTRRNTK